MKTKQKKITLGQLTDCRCWRWGEISLVDLDICIAKVTPAAAVIVVLASIRTVVVYVAFVERDRLPGAMRSG